MFDIAVEELLSEENGRKDLTSPSGIRLEGASQTVRLHVRVAEPLDRAISWWTPRRAAWSFLLPSSRAIALM
jgi:hypothetical protein